MSKPREFNSGQPYHGSDKVKNGLLKGATDKSDYFYFFCPSCTDNQMLRVLEFEQTLGESGNKYNSQCQSTAPQTFVLAFKLHCEQCEFSDFVKLSNAGWQGGSHATALA